MADTISYNPAELQKLAEAFNSFDKVFDGSKGIIEEKVAQLEESWEGDDSEEAQAELTKIKTALANIKQNSTSYNNLVAGKAEAFGAVRF